MILKLTQQIGNRIQVEYISADSATQSSATVTLVNVKRYIDPYDGSDFTSNGDGLDFYQGALVEQIFPTQFAENAMMRTNEMRMVNSGSILCTLGSSRGCIAVGQYTTAQITAMTKTGSMIFFDSTTNQMKFYDNSNVLTVATSTGSAANAGFGNRGEGQLPTPTQVFNQTGTGSSGAPLMVAVKDVVHNSGAMVMTGAVSYVVGASGSTIDSSLIATSPGSGDLLQVRGNGDIEGRTTTQLGISTGFKHEATVTTASADVGAGTTATGTLVPTWTGTGVDANSLKVGSTIHIRLGGNYDLGAVGTLDVRLMVAGVAVGEFEMNLAGGNDSTWNIDAVIDVRTIGVSGTAMPGGVATFGTLESDVGGAIVVNMQAFDPGRLPPGQFTLNSTVQAPIALTAHFGVSNGSNFINIQTGSITVTSP